MLMTDAALLRALAAVLRAGSFDGAAQALHVTPSAISQRIKALEEQVGTAVIIRAQPCLATSAGARLLRHAEDVALLERQLVSDLGLPGGRAHVRIAVNADSLATWFLPALSALPELLFDLEIDDESHSHDLLRRGEVQAAVTSRAAPLSGCDSHTLGRLRYVATASPAFVSRWFPDGVTAAALAEAPALTFNRKDALQAQWAERVTGAPVVLQTHRIASSHAFVTASRLGLGWGVNPEGLVREEIAAGRLVALTAETLEVDLYWQVTRLSARALAPLTAAVRQAALGALA